MDGRSVNIYTVIGVLPQGGWLPPDGGFDVLTPIGQADPQDLTDREGRYWTALARLKRGSAARPRPPIRIESRDNSRMSIQTPTKVSVRMR